MEKKTVKRLFNSYFQLFPNSSSIAIANNTKFIYYEPSAEIDLHIRPGDPVMPDTVTYEAITKGRRVQAEKGASLFGVPYFAMSQPIIEREKVIGAMTAIFPQKPQTTAAPYITIKLDDRWVPIHFNDVIYLEAQNRKTNVTALRAEGTHRFNLTEIESSLPKQTFIRCHRSYIININHVEEIQPDSHSTFILVMRNQSRVPVSQRYSKQIRTIFGF